MDAPLQGDTGGHTGTAPTISRVAPCPKVGRRGSADGLKQEKVAGRGSADGLKQEMIAGRGSADGQKQEMYAGEVLADGQIQEMIAGEVLADDIPRCLSQENSSPLIFRAVYRRKTVRRR